jgi:central kinetochore subunit Mis15/CHL4
MAKNGKERQNVLPNTYIPVLPKKVLNNILSRLTRSSLLELMYIWPKLLNTQPHIDKGQNKYKQKELNKKVLREVNEIKHATSKFPKRKIIDKLLFEYWSNGLNLLQLSQVDCQLIVDRPNAYYWILSTVRDMDNKEVPVLLNPKTFLDQLAKELNLLYMTYIYVCRHPVFPLIIIRIQVFDLQPINASNNANRPHISSHRPYFLAVPMNSPHIIHSTGNDIVAKIVLQAVERNIPQNPRNLLRLETSPNQKPIRSLESMHILHGNSRFGNSLGIWTPYADATVDMLPLGPPEKHNLLQEKNESENEDDDDNDDIGLKKLKQIANLRFKGSINGKLKSEKLFDDKERAGNLRKRRTRMYDSNLNSSDDEEGTEGFKSGRNEFTSVAPIQYSEFIIKDEIKTKDKVENANPLHQNEMEEDNFSRITMKLSGLDVFAGLHEISTKTTNKTDMIIDPATIPCWLTGEEGTSCGVIKEGKFSKTL